jgi:putative FmdB family regulatory protein
MPFYPLECKKCGHKYDVMSLMSECEENIKKAKCPECKSKSKDRLIGNVNFTFTNPVGTDRFSNSHDYRHNWNMDRPGGVRDERKTAEEKSHVGANPYNDIDDVSSGKHFGEVK